MQTITTPPRGITARNRPDDPVDHPVRSLLVAPVGIGEVAEVTTRTPHLLLPNTIHVCPSRPAAAQEPFDPPRSEPKVRP
ncbi:hypothetical protein OPAG_04054 [Rhodococcus opacus PD630]|nr:hypothetical protein OPAG_04054 [Rhodococcus opacus PD630]PBC57868.1 hypothetical protein CJ177_08410 [Rhodococcus sp. ACPA1]RZK71574.1 MAG: hypothetical protein EOP25_04710 [Rhodococcus sp. (in: high G+C Gram-positive bacteria)]